MESKSYKEQLEKKDFKLVDFVKRSGEFETEDRKKIPWKSYVLKAKINGVVMNFKLDKVFNDTMEEMLENE